MIEANFEYENITLDMVSDILPSSFEFEGETIEISNEPCEQKGVFNVFFIVEFLLEINNS